MESDSRHARQPRRRLRVHRARALRDLQTGKTIGNGIRFAGAPDPRRITAASHIMKLETTTADFSDEQKRYLEGFMSGLQVGRVGRGIGLAGAAGPVGKAD